MANSLLSSLFSLLNTVTWQPVAKFVGVSASAAVIGNNVKPAWDYSWAVVGICSAEQIKKNAAVTAELNIDRIETLELEKLHERAEDNVLRNDLDCFRKTYSDASRRLYARYLADGFDKLKIAPLRKACVTYARSDESAASCGVTGSAVQSPSAPLAPFSTSYMPQAVPNMVPQPPAPRSSAGKKKASASARTSKPLAAQPNITINYNYFGGRLSSAPSASPSPSAASEGGAPMPDSARDVLSNMIGPR